MSCLNASPVLNSLELRILDRLPINAKHVAIIGAGDGRLARAFSEKASSPIKLSLVESSECLRSHLTSLGDVSADPFDIDWLTAQAEKNGRFDCVVFYNIHEYWDGKLLELRKALSLLSDTGRAWITFLNAYARPVLPYSLPQKTISYVGLAQPARHMANMDYGAWVSYLNMIDAGIDSLWGLVEPEIFSFCQSANKGEPVEPLNLTAYGVEMVVKTLQDALLWGGTFIGIELHIKPEGEEPKQPEFVIAQFSPIAFQSLIAPYPGNSMDSLDDFLADMEIRAWQKKADTELNAIGKILVEKLDEQSPKSVLIIGASWGKDAYLISKERPSWKVVGVDSSSEKIDQGMHIFPEGTVELRRVDYLQPLPFEDNSFDAVVTFGTLSRCHSPLAEKLTKECARIANKAVYHLEDSRGPAQSLQLKPLYLENHYKEIGLELELSQIKIQDQPSGLIIAKALKS